jgi:hypothetical protein
MTLHTPAPSLRSVCAAAAVLALSHNANASFEGAALNVQLRLLPAPISQTNATNLVVGSATGAEFTVTQNSTPAPGSGPLSALDDSALNVDWTTTPTGGLVDITYEMRTAVVTGMLLQFWDPAGGTFTNVQRVYDTFANGQTVGNTTGWGFSQSAGNHDIAFAISDLDIGNNGNYVSYAVSARYSFDYTAAAPVPSPPPTPAWHWAWALWLRCCAAAKPQPRQAAPYKLPGPRSQAAGQERNTALCHSSARCTFCSVSGP